MEVVRANTEEGVGVDVALECVGLEASLNACAEAVRRRGTVVQVGLHTRPASVDAMLWALKDITLEATWCYPTTIWPRIAGMIGRALPRREDRHRDHRARRRRGEGLRRAARPVGQEPEDPGPRELTVSLPRIDPMHYIIHGLDKPGALQTRLANYDAHKAYLAKAPSRS